MPRDGPDEPINIPDGQIQCDECGAVVPDQQVLTKRTPDNKPDIDLCPVCQ